MKRLIFLLSIFLLLSSTLFPQGRSSSDSAKVPSITEKVAGLEKYPGYFNFYWDAKAGKIWLEIDKWNAEFLYVESLPAGIGSNDLGLDRGQLGQSYIVSFERTCPRVLLIASNEGYHASNDIGLDCSLGLQWRPLLTDNVIITAGMGFLVPGQGYKDIYRANTRPVPGFGNPPAGNVDDFLYSGILTVTLTY